MTHEPSKPLVEWPTATLYVGHWIAYVLLALSYSTHPVIALLGLSITLAFHSSLLHEIIHNHPFRSTPLNDFCGKWPMDLWLPYLDYKKTHLKHHVNRHLTDPKRDPESRYWNPTSYRQQSALLRAWLRLEQPLLGRLLLRSWTIVFDHWWGYFKRITAGDTKALKMVIEHALYAVPLLWFIHSVAEIPLGVYFCCAIVPANALILLRSFAEHRANEPVAERTAIVEHAHLLGPLYLYNNLHALHHAEPTLPWYQYRARFQQRREALLNDNGGLWYKNYGEIIRRYAFKAHDQLLDPLHAHRNDPSEP